MTRRKITVRDAGEILEHWQAGRSIRAINRSLGASRPIIRKYAAIAEAHGFKPGAPPPTEGWRAFLEKVAPETFNPILGTAMTAELRSYHETIKGALQHTTVMTTWLRMREKPGIKASYSSFYRYVRKHLPEFSEQHTITVRREDPPPGEESQLDYGYLGLWKDPISAKNRRVWVFANILSCSRHIFARTVFHMDQASWIESHVANFEFWQGTPQRVILDNLKTGVLKADLYDPQFNKGYEELAHHYHILLDPARLGHAKDKPRVERIIPYIRDSFWAGRTFHSPEEINRELLSWCLKVAGRRIHGTTRRQPLEVFGEVEQTALQPLPPEPFEIATWTKAKIGWDCYFYAGGGGYTAPYQFAGKEIMVQLTAKLVKAYFGYALIKTHIRVGKWQRSTDWDDFPPEKSAFFRRTPDWCRHQAKMLGDEVRKTVETLLEDHALYHLRQIHGILRLSEKYGQERLNAACARANCFGDPSYRTIKNILEKGLEQANSTPLSGLQAGAYLRGPQELLLPLIWKEEENHG